MQTPDPIVITGATMLEFDNGTDFCTMTIAHVSMVSLSGNKLTIDLLGGQVRTMVFETKAEALRLYGSLREHCGFHQRPVPGTGRSKSTKS